MVTTSTITPDEKQQRLMKASKKYLRGNIDLNEYSSSEKKYMPDYYSATLELAKTRSIIWRFLTLFGAK